VLRLRHTLRDQRGGTLVEAIVGLLLLSLTISFAAASSINSLRVQSTSERMAAYATATQSIMAKARQADYSDLGFYADDAQVRTGAVTLPVVDDSAAALAEQAILLGETRPASTSSFDVAPVETFENGGATYRVETFVTAVPPADGDDVSRARRVVVQGEWAPTVNAGQLDGTCTGADVHCSVQMIVRTASGSDIDPSTGASAADSSACTSTTPNVCESYIRSGRVLDGATMVSDADTARLNSDVDLYARTSVVADAVVATWTYQVASGSVVVPKAKSVELHSLDGGTRWSGLVEADTGDPAGTILPGKVDVTFTATVPGGSVTSTTPAFWTVARDTGSEIDAVAVTLADPDSEAWCTPNGTGTPIRVTTTGGSVGMSATSATTAGADRAWATIAVREPNGAVTSQIVAATPIAVDPVTLNLSGTILQVSTNTTWELTAPGTASCATSAAASLVLARAIDGSTTTMPLRLAAQPDSAPTPPVTPGPEPTPEPEPEPEPGPSIPADPSGLRLVTKTPTSATFSWTAVEGATSYETSPAGTLTGTSATVTGAPGATVSLRVRAVNEAGASPWSGAVQAVLPPAAPTGLQVTNIRGKVASLSWNAAAGATGYTLTGASGATISGTKATAVFTIGSTTAVTVSATGAGGTTPGASASVEMPTDRLELGQQLTNASTSGVANIDNRRGTSIVSTNGRYVAYLQAAGNFVLYDLNTNAAVAYTHNTTIGTTRLAMQTDGNLVLYQGSTALKNTATTGRGAARVIVQDDGNLVVYSAAGSPLWARSYGSGNTGAGSTFFQAW
jgi:hypothetical protein